MYINFDLLLDMDNYFNLVCNDIFKMKADVLVFSDTPPFMEMKGELCKEIYRRANLDRGELRNRNKRNELLTAREYDLYLYATEGEKLGYKWLFHINVPKYLKNNWGENKQLVNCYKLALQGASELGAESIVFPLLGTGGEYSFDPVQAYDLVSSYINDHMCLDFNISNIILAINDRTLYDKLKRFEKFRQKFILERQWELESVMLFDGDTDPGFYYPQRSSDLREVDKIRMYMEFERSEQEREQGYKKICQDIKDQRKEYLSQNPQKTDKDFSMQMISDVIINWLNTPKEDYSGDHYERKDRSASELAEMICAVPSTVTTLSMGKGKFPSRDLLIALAIAMKLNREERVRFILYRNEDERYPHGTKEEVIEGILNDYNDFPDYDTVNQKLYEMTGMTIRKQPGGITKQKDKEKEIEHL